MPREWLITFNGPQGPTFVTFNNLSQAEERMKEIPSEQSPRLYISVD